MALHLLPVGPPLVARLPGRRLGARRPVTRPAPPARPDQRERHGQRADHERSEPQ
jgi:hypothetical protein